MSRQILFRAKVLHPDPMTNPESGWVEGFYYQDLVNGEVRHFIKNCPCDWEIDVETLCQSTNLRDKEGRVIFENDILHYCSFDREGSDHHYRVICKWDEVSAYILVATHRKFYNWKDDVLNERLFKVNEEDAPIWDLSEVFVGFYGEEGKIFDNENLEIEGNIFDHSNLLNDGREG